MNRSQFRKCIEKEVYGPYQLAKGRLNCIDRIWCKNISPELNSVFLIRKKQYYEDRGGVYAILARMLHVKLMRRYGINVTTGCKIGLGLRIAHPCNITFTECTIGENFQIYQGCTIGQKFHGSGMYPTIGNNVIMFAGSQIIGSVRVGDNVTIGASALVVKDAIEPGVYVGIPARLVSNKVTDKG